jgi:hypothetical protein
MKATKSKCKQTAAVSAYEFKPEPALLRRRALVWLGLCAVWVCGALSAAAQTLSVVDTSRAYSGDHGNPAYVGETLTFVVTPDPNGCYANGVEINRDLNYSPIIYDGNPTVMGIDLSWDNSTGTYRGTYTTTEDDIGYNDVEVPGQIDSCNDQIAGFTLTVADFDYYGSYDAAWIDNNNAATISGYPTAWFGPVTYPDYPDYNHTYNDPEVDPSPLFDYSKSSGFGYTPSGWSIEVPTGNPNDYHISLTLDEKNWHDIDAWVIWAAVTKFNNAGPKDDDCSLSPPYFGAGAHTGLGGTIAYFYNGANIQYTISPATFVKFSNVVSFDIIQTKERSTWRRRNFFSVKCFSI